MGASAGGGRSVCAFAAHSCSGRRGCGGETAASSTGRQRGGATPFDQCFLCRKAPLGWPPENQRRRTGHRAL
eukprot:6173515-Pleurochrysis_carterae.AAC.1